MSNRRLYTLTHLLICLFTACSTKPEIRLAQDVNLERFMGSWKVIAHTPTFMDEEAYNAVESYSLADDGSIETTYTFNEGSFTGERTTYNPTGYVVPDTGNAVWKMQFIWPFKADYRIMYVDSDYQHTIIARKKRDMFWIMSRQAPLDAKLLEKYLTMLQAEGYSLDSYRMVPHGTENEK